MTDFNEARSEIEVLAKEYEQQKCDLNEADTRKRYIDTVLHALGWFSEDMRLEEKNAEGYSDYVMYAPNRCMIIEAKKKGIYFELPFEPTQKKYKLNYLIKSDANLGTAVTQVLNYALSSGIPYCAVTNGHQYIFFGGSRTDGVDPMEGNAIIFDSLGVIVEKFTRFWNLLSKDSVSNNKALHYILSKQYRNTPPKLSQRIPSYPGNKARNVFQTDLQILSDLVLEDVRHRDEIKKDFLKDCYCPSGALSQYALISKKMLSSRYDSFFDEIEKATPIPATTKKGINSDVLNLNVSKRPILLVGDVGVGKTSFIQNLMLIEAESIFEQCINIYIDLGSKATLTDDFKSFVINEITRQINNKYKIDIHKDGFVRKVYSPELRQFAEGIYRSIKDSNPEKYLDKELEMLEGKITNSEEHLKRSLEYASRSHGKQIVIILDNADQRTEDLQQEAFLVSHELATHWNTTVFLALRPETFYRSKKHGALSGYHPKVFTIAPPRTDDVVRKRLEFALKITSGEIKVANLPGIQINLEDIDQLIRAFIFTLDWRNHIIEFLDNMSSGNVRSALDYIKQFFGSGHVDTWKIINIFKKNGEYIIPLHEFMRAIMYGDTEYYDPDRSDIANLFDVSHPDKNEHFLTPLLLGYLSGHTEKSQGGGFVDTNNVYEYLQGRGYIPEQINKSFTYCYNRKLLETNTRRIPSSEDTPRALRITSAGAYHVSKLQSQFTYVDSMLVDTPVFDEELRDRITTTDDIFERLELVELFREYLDEIWASMNHNTIGYDWKVVSQELRNDIDLITTKLKSNGK